MVQKLRFLTDSDVKRGIAISRLDTQVKKETLVKERKAYQMRSDSNKIEVIKTYVALGGNLALTAAATKVPIRTLESWKVQSWWKTIVAELKKADKLELSAKTKTIIEKSLELMNDRLDRGDIFYNPKTGEIQRKPVAIKELHHIAKDMMDRKHILDKAFETSDQIETPTGDKLAALAERFAQLAEMSLEKKRPVVTDVILAKEIVYAQNESGERQESPGLQPTSSV